MKWTKEQKRRNKEIAFEDWKKRVLADPTKHHSWQIARYEMNLTQKELGALPGVAMHDMSISKIERGASPGNRNTRARLAFALGRNVQDLFPQ